MNESIKNKNKYIYLVKVDIVGPYLPLLPQMIEDYAFTQETIPNEGWVGQPPAPEANSSPDGSGIRINVILSTENASVVVFKLSCNKPSAKVAYGIGESLAKELCSFLSVSVIGCRYFYKIKEIKLLDEDKVTEEYESPSSESVLGVSYSRKEIQQAQIDYIHELGKHLDDPIMKSCIEYFSKGLDAEVMGFSLDEKAILYYFKIIELIGNKFIKNNGLSKEERKKKYNSVINGLTSDLKKQIDYDEKLKRLRDAFSQIKIIDQSIISENIKNAARMFGFSEEGMKRLGNAIDMRNKKLVHPELNFEITIEDNRDFRELAKIYIKEYAKRILKIDNAAIDKIPQVKEIGGWYRFTYLNSAKAEAAKKE